MFTHTTLTPAERRSDLQHHLDEVMFALLIAEPTMQRTVELMMLRSRLEQMLDDATTARAHPQH